MALTNPREKRSVEVRTEAASRHADLGFACVVLGCLWTAAAVLLLVQAGPSRGRSPQALVALACLVGLFTSYRTRLALWVHRAIAAVLAVVLTLHWPPILYAEVGALAVLAVTALVNLKLAASLVRWLAQ